MYDWGIIERRMFGPPPMARVIDVVRIVLIAWGGVSLAASVAMGAVFAMSGFAEEPLPEITAGADADATQLAALASPPAPRLPRARPEEPLFTGSIRPAIGSPELWTVPLRGDTSGGLLEIMQEYELQKRVALSEAAEEESLIEEGSRDDEAPLALLTEDAYLTDDHAIQSCEDNLRAGLPNPSSLERISATTGVYRAPGDDAVVNFDFEALNGIGVPLFMQVQCVFAGDSLARLDVFPR